MDFGPHRLLTGAQRRMQSFRHADEVLDAIGMYLMSLDPPKAAESTGPSLPAVELLPSVGIDIAEIATDKCG